MPFKTKRPANPILVTHAFSISITNTDAVIAVTKAVLAGRGVEDPDAQIADADGKPDIGKCIAALMAESLAALQGATGAEVGEAETYLEVVV